MTHTPVLMPEPEGTLLGKSTVYSSSYDPALLQPIPRALGRNAVGKSDFRGTDVWGLYEVTWLNEHGMPQVAVGELLVPATTPCIVESKSLKLYVGSFTQTRFPSIEAVAETMSKDISAAAGGPCVMTLRDLADWEGAVERMPGLLLEAEILDLAPVDYEVNPTLLEVVEGEVAEETLSSNLLRSLCPVTGQPDHASLTIRYKGPKIAHRSLLAYIVSYREHRGFHEQCVEQIYTDLSRLADFEFLEVYACFTRRGGIDISPFRSSRADRPAHVIRAQRQ